jgi:hypothetical protein
MKTVKMAQRDNEIRSKLFFGGDKEMHIGWVEVFNGVNVIEYIVDKEQLQVKTELLILSIGDSLKEQCFGAFDRSRHTLPY